MLSFCVADKVQIKEKNVMKKNVMKKVTKIMVGALFMVMVTGALIICAQTLPVEGCVPNQNGSCKIPGAACPLGGLGAICRTVTPLCVQQGAEGPIPCPSECICY
jgi:hypothetical protein